MELHPASEVLDSVCEQGWRDSIAGRGFACTWLTGIQSQVLRVVP